MPSTAFSIPSRGMASSAPRKQLARSNGAGAATQLRSVAAAAVANHRGLHPRLGHSQQQQQQTTQQQQVPAAAAAEERPPRLLPLVSESVAIEAQTRRFERLAGRSAMIGVVAALVGELLTQQSIFVTLSPEAGSSLLQLFAGALAAASLAAAASKRRVGLDLLEAVVASLTAAQRSDASVTGRQVDTAVDSVINAAFPGSMLVSLLLLSDDATTGNGEENEEQELEA